MRHAFLPAVLLLSVLAGCSTDTDQDPATHQVSPVQQEPSVDEIDARVSGQKGPAKPAVEVTRQALTKRPAMPGVPQGSTDSPAPAQVDRLPVPITEKQGVADPQAADPSAGRTVGVSSENVAAITEQVVQPSIASPPPKTAGEGDKTEVASDTATATSPLTPAVPVADRPSRYVSLFDGETLTGWTGDEELWKVENGCIVGEVTTADRYDIDLVTEQRYSNFVLKLSYRLVYGNSGIRIRAMPVSGRRLAAYEVDISHLNKNTGNIFDPNNKFGTLTEVTKELRPDLNTIIDTHGWNDVVITVAGSRMSVSWNGYVCQNFVWPRGHHKTGVIALNLRNRYKSRIEFRHINIRPLTGRESLIAQATGFLRDEGVVDLPDADRSGNDVRIAVFDFDDLGPSVELAPLRHSIVDMLMSDLPGYEGIRAVERMRVKGFLEERELENMAIAQSTRSDQGQRLLGADYYITGTYSATAEQITLTTKLIRTGDDYPTKSWTVRKKPEELFALQQDLVKEVLAGVGLEEPRKRTKPAIALERSPIIAVFPFENRSTLAKLDSMEVAFAEILQVNLSSLPGMTVVERDSLQKILNEQTLTLAQLTDPLTALKVGRLSGANRLVFGAFTQIGDRLRFDVRVADANTASLAATTTLLGDANEPIELIEQLAVRIAGSIGAALPDDADRLVAGSTPTRNIEAVMYLGEAQQAFMNGRIEDSEAAYERVLVVDPNNTRARWGLVEVASRQRNRDRVVELTTDLLGRDLKTSGVTKDRIFQYLLSALLSLGREEDFVRYAEQADPEKLHSFYKARLAGIKTRAGENVDGINEFDAKIAALRREIPDRRLHLRPSVKTAQLIAEASPPDGFDQFTIKASGNRLEVLVNGIPTFDYTDSAPILDGITGLALDKRIHSRVIVKDLRVRDLSKEEDSKDVADQAMESLFDGNSLDGWVGDIKSWKVENGMMVGEGSDYLLRLAIAREKKWTDFVLEVKCRVEEGGAGVYFRSRRSGDDQLTGYWVTLGRGSQRGTLIDTGGMTVEDKFRIIRALQQKYSFYSELAYEEMVNRYRGIAAEGKLVDAQGKPRDAMAETISTLKELIREFRYSNDDDERMWFDSGTIMGFFHRFNFPSRNSWKQISDESEREILELSMESFGWYSKATIALEERLAKLDARGGKTSSIAERLKVLEEKQARLPWTTEDSDGLIPSYADLVGTGHRSTHAKRRRSAWVALARDMMRQGQTEGAAEILERFYIENGLVTEATRHIIDGFEETQHEFHWPRKTVLIWGGEEMVRDAWRRMKQIWGYRVNSVMEIEPTYAHIAPYSLIVMAIPGYRSFTPDECLALEAYVASGGSLLVVVSPGFRAGQVMTHRPLLEMFGASVGMEETILAESTSIVPHAITDGITSAMARNAVSLSVPEESGQVLIRSGEKGLLAVIGHGRGRVVLASFGQWFLPDPNLPKDRPLISRGSKDRQNEIEMPLVRGPLVQTDLLANVLNWLLEPQLDRSRAQQRKALFRAALPCIQIPEGEQPWDRIEEGLKILSADLNRLGVDDEIAQRCVVELFNAAVCQSQTDYGRDRRSRLSTRRTSPQSLVQLARRLRDRYPDSPRRLTYEYRAADAQLRLVEWNYMFAGGTLDGETVEPPLREFSKIDAPQTSSIWAWSQLRPACSLHQGQEYDDALRLVQQVAERMPVGAEKTLAMLVLGDCLKAAGDVEQANRYWQALVEAPSIQAKTRPKHFGFLTDLWTRVRTFGEIAEHRLSGRKSGYRGF